MLICCHCSYVSQGLNGTLTDSTTMLISLECVSSNGSRQEYAQSLICICELSGVDWSSTLS